MPGCNGWEQGWPGHGAHRPGVCRRPGGAAAGLAGPSTRGPPCSTNMWLSRPTCPGALGTARAASGSLGTFLLPMCLRPLAPVGRALPAPRLSQILGSVVMLGPTAPTRAQWLHLSIGVRYGPDHPLKGCETRMGGGKTKRCRGGEAGAGPRGHHFPIYPLLCPQCPSTSPTQLQCHRGARGAYALITSRCSCLRGLGRRICGLDTSHRCLRTRAGFGRVLPPALLSPSLDPTRQGCRATRALLQPRPKCPRAKRHHTPCRVLHCVPPPRWRYLGKQPPGSRRTRWDEI